MAVQGTALQARFGEAGEALVERLEQGMGHNVILCLFVCVYSFASIKDRKIGDGVWRP